MDDRAVLIEMGQRARKVGRGDAAGVIVDQLMEMIKNKEARSQESEARM
jgi:hypothetical protein